MPLKQETALHNKASPHAAGHNAAGDDSGDDGGNPPRHGASEVTTTLDAEPPENGDGRPATVPQKRKKNESLADSKDDDAGRTAAALPPKKEPRRDGGDEPAQPRQQRRSSQVQLLRFLLSPAALAFCRPADEEDDSPSDSKASAETPTTTYSTALLSPFEELLCAVVLSRPISHRLGLRTIRTVLNAPHCLTSPAAIQRTGEDAVRQALERARTQHKDKTAAEIALLADVVADKFASSSSSSNDAGDGGGTDDDVSLDRVREEADRDVGKERELLKKSVKGLGDTGLDIFFRRIQWRWLEAYPFVDKRTAEALGRLGLPKEAEGLRALLEEDGVWGELDEDLGDEGKDEEVRKRRAFVLVLERAIGADLEKKIDEVLEAATKS